MATKKFLLVAVLAIACLTFSYGSAHATLYTVDSVLNAATSADRTPFTTLTDLTTNTVYTLGAITSLAQAQAAVTANIPSGDAWIFSSAGDGTPSATQIGLQLSVPAGTYHIRAVSGGYTYDNWDWSSDYGRYMWLLQIMTGVNGVYNSYTLGNGLTNTYGSANDAGSANAGDTINITLADAGTLTFWIWDVNTMDNLGGLTFDVATPLPPSLLLMLGGLLFVLVPRLRSRIHG